MAPKKKKQEKQPKNKPSSSKSKPQSSSSTSTGGPKLQISAENENRLRRLLLNTGRPAPSQAPNAGESLTKAQKAKKLRSVYEKLSCEGFSDDQVERALSHVKENASFEAALDWLCLVLPPKELPVKFRSVTSLLPDEGASVGIILTAQDDWTGPKRSSDDYKDELAEVPVRVKGQREDNSLDSFDKSQADWIRHYVEQEEDAESDSWDTDAVDKVLEPRSYDSIVEEYHSTRLAAINAKERKDKKGQEQAGQIIRKLKQEMADLGISEDVLAAEFEDLRFAIKESSSETDSSNILGNVQIEEKIDTNAMKSCSHDVSSEDVLDEDLGGIELGDMFVEDASFGVLPPEIVELQKREKMRELSSGKNLEKLEGIWKKGDPQKTPKAVLQQLCQRSGWEAPKYDKLHRTGHGCSYTVSVIRKASGRGKSRRDGGLLTVQLPNPTETFETSEDAQNRVAAFALYRLFPDLPVHLVITDPYASFVLEWKEGDLSGDRKNNEADRRTNFVDSLLNADAPHSDSSLPITSEKSEAKEVKTSAASDIDVKAENEEFYKEAESSYLREVHENKKRQTKYKNMLKSRDALPISALKGDILHLLTENDVLVVCGETGCGKTTQVPQFILDHMIEDGCGGICNIVCTQPRRIAAISVAERVAEERCESSPGSKDSLVGYQVRLETARNERTKLLFCTTGILLRTLAGNNNLANITHIIVDEVHERSLLGDFLLTILKNLIEKQSAESTKKLKVILMSATVDSQLFSHYFGMCPVIHAEGRTHPVSTYFLEDIHEKMNYRLTSDSPASIQPETQTQKGHAVDNHRGKRNLVLSAWGDESLLSEICTNPHYIPENYRTYSEQTRENLKRLNENVIDYDLLEDLVCHIDKTYPEGAILVFLPGVSEISMLLDKLTASYQFGGLASDWILPLHSSIDSLEQKKVFLRPPDKIRKVIIATNIAETSITIDDVVYVIDSGKHKENRYNPGKKLSSMVEDWISRANARQRRGRAGRVKPGICFCLYTRHRYEKIMRPFQLPEMLRMPLVELCLQIKLLSLGRIMPFLLKALEPPTEEAITTAVSQLYEVGALEGDEELTPLGHHLAKLPVDVLIGKMMLYGAIFGCLSPILSISAILSYKSPFLYPKDERQAVQRAKIALLVDKLGGASDLDYGKMQSDHLVMMVAYRKWEKILRENGRSAAESFCKSHFLSSSVMYMIRDMRIQFGTLLADIGVIDLPQNYQVRGKWKDKLDHWFSDTSQVFNVYSNHSSVVKALLCAGLYPNVAAMEDGIAEKALGNLKKSKHHLAWYDSKREVHIHPSSINGDTKTFQYPFLVFLEKVETSKVFLRDTTITSPYSILLFGGSMHIQHQSGVVIIDGWLKMAAPAQTAVLFKELRSTLHSILKELIKKPQTANIADNAVIRSIVHLLLEEDKPKR